MDKELKEKWIAALRGGDYRQGHRFLYKDGAYCCLGVLHELATGETPPTSWSSKPQVLRFIDEPIEQHLGGSCAHTALVAMNDNGKSFAEIADWIEKNL